MARTPRADMNRMDTIRTQRENAARIVDQGMFQIEVIKIGLGFIASKHPQKSRLGFWKINAAKKPEPVCFIIDQKFSFELVIGIKIIFSVWNQFALRDLSSRLQSRGDAAGEPFLDILSGNVQCINQQADGGAVIKMVQYAAHRWRFIFGCLGTFETDFFQIGRGGAGDLLLQETAHGGRKSQFCIGVASSAQFQVKSGGGITRRLIIAEAQDIFEIFTAQMQNHKARRIGRHWLTITKQADLPVRDGRSQIS